MTYKAAILVLGVALLVAMLRRSFAGGKAPKIEAARKCPCCGAYALAGAPCARPDCPGG